jgi:hypothetical protein
MLNKKTCITCHQKNETKWDEELWNQGYVDCPKEEVNLTYKGKPVSKTNPYYNLFSQLFGNTDINEIPKHCPYQK